MENQAIQQTICLGLQFDQKKHAPSLYHTVGHSYVGPNQFLEILETILGIGVPERETEHLRLEMYRQAMADIMAAESSPPFFATSFQVDSMGTARKLLAMRDELAETGRPFQSETETPERIRVIDALELYIKHHKDESLLQSGIPDRLNAVITRLKLYPLPFQAVFHYEPRHLLPIGWKRLLQAIEEKPIPVAEWKKEENTENSSDLARFQAALSADQVVERGNKLEGDGSLLILRTRRDTDAATWVGRLCTKNPDLKPVFLIPEKKRILDNALLAEGLPGMGVLTNSAARPSLQLLKLAPAFLWQPTDPEKIKEFTSLTLQPLHPRLAQVISLSISQTPGIGNPDWEKRIKRFFGWLKEKSLVSGNPSIYEEARKEYNFWFHQNRTPIGMPVSIKEVIKLYRHLMTWAFKKARQDAEVNTSLHVLREQSRQIIEVLQALPASETTLSALTLERIIRNVYESAPLEYRESDSGHFEYFQHEGACPEPAANLIWWSFVRKPPNPSFSSWYPVEEAFLASSGYPVQKPDIYNDRQLWYYLQPVFQARERLLMIIPEFSDGKEAYPHSLHDYLHAMFSNIDKITFHLEHQFESPLPGIEHAATRKPIPLLPPEPPGIHLELGTVYHLDEITQSSPTGLIKLIYYPHQWFFQKIARLNKSALLQTLHESTHKGKLAHRFFELVLKEKLHESSREQVFSFLDRIAIDIFRTEGSNFLLYGKETDRILFFETVKKSIWHFCTLLRKNGWKVSHIEEQVTDTFQGMKMTGIPDLVLERKGELAIIDLKWSGMTRRQKEIQNKEDLQLALYAHFLRDPEKTIHTGYYIIKDNRLVSRNSSIFENGDTGSVELTDQAVHAEVLYKLQYTLNWRLDQLRQGLVEIRTAETAPALDEHYGDILLQEEMLEMKNEDDMFDEYSSLVFTIE